MPATATDRLFGLTTSVAVKAPCRTVATTNLTLSGLQTLNGIVLVANDRVLCVGQTSAVDNGIYVASSSSWQRAADFDGARDAVQGTQIPITANGGQTVLYEVSTANPFTIGTTALTFAQRYSANATYDRTAAEAVAGVTPINYGKWPSPWKDVSRFVSDNTGVTNVATQFANALAAEKNIVIPEGTYNLGSTGLTGIRSGMSITGAGRATTNLTYSGSGTAIDVYGISNLILERFDLTTTNTAASGIRLGNGVQHIALSDIALYGDTSNSNTGAGLVLQAGSPGAFSGNLMARLFYALGYKYGVKALGTDIGVNTWTCMSFRDVFLIGKVAPIAGSAGVWFDANTNGVGSTWIGGTIEGYATGLLVDNGGYGLDFMGDIEACTVPYTVGASMGGRIHINGPSAQHLQVSANGTSNRWLQDRHLNGVCDRESYFTQRHTVYDDSTSSAEFAVYRGPASSSYISGTANPTKKFSVTMGIGSDAAGARNFLTLAGQTVHWDSQSPATTSIGTWAKGDVCFNSNATVGQPKGWHCTVAGTPGTWVSMGNL